MPLMPLTFIITANSQALSTAGRYRAFVRSQYRDFAEPTLLAVIVELPIQGVRRFS
jgi:hypothetical protein